MSKLPGNMRYMAPELLAGASSYSPLMDVYSFGVVAWEMLAEREPFAGVQVRELVRLVGRDALRPRAEDAAPNGSAALLRLVQACWHQRSEERPRFAQVVEHLRAYKSQVISYKLQVTSYR